MVNARTCLTLFILSFGTALATASCGSSSAGAGPGSAGGAGRVGGSGGAGAILAAGAPAVAGSTSGSSAGATGRAGAGSGAAGGAAVATGALGSTCGGNTDCGTGLLCLTPDSTDLGAGGPSLGVCTAACSVDADCSPFEAGAGCVDFGTTAAPKGFCFEACTQGGDATAFDTKCQARGDFACTDLSPITTPPSPPAPFCMPRCRADAECGTGLFCDVREGLCVKTKTPGDPVGSACDPNATTATCQGICLGMTATTGVCAELCSGLLPCMYVGKTPGGLCAGALSTTFGPLDQGYCEPNCACTSECKITGDVCRAWATTEATLKTALGANGLCFPNLAAGDVELTTCSQGGSGGGP